MDAIHPARIWMHPAEICKMSKINVLISLRYPSTATCCLYYNSREWKQLGSQWMDFHEIRFNPLMDPTIVHIRMILSVKVFISIKYDINISGAWIFQKSFEKIQVSLTADNNTYLLTYLLHGAESFLRS